MNEIERQIRISVAIADPSPEVWWWLSFADGSLPKGSQFLGVAIVQGANVGQAAHRAFELGCNPGGEVQGMVFGDDEIDEIPETHRNRLLSREEIKPWAE